MEKFQKWFWLELIGFDRSREDLGVKDYLENAGCVPDAVSLLLPAPDFVHLHENSSEDCFFPRDVCSYGGRGIGSAGEEHLLWKKSELKRLVSGLHDYGVEVFFAVFDMVTDEALRRKWVNEHSEILATTRNGEKQMSINPLSRFRDGGYYEDFFVKKLMEVVRYYNFDGFHCADGYNHLRLPLYWSDYSDDMVEQFCAWSGVKIPGDFSGGCEGREGFISKRADWIWRKKRAEWITFYADRWERYCRKIIGALHGEEKKFLFNTSWTRDPFEALYRYGIDYGKIAAAGADSFIQECPGAGNEIGVEGGRVHKGFYYKIIASILLVKAGTPETDIVALNHIHDTHENWEILRHAPTFLEKEIYFYPNLFFLGRDGKPARCVEGFLACLADGISKDEWMWLHYNWSRSFRRAPSSLRGATLILSGCGADRCLGDFIETRGATDHNILYRLLAEGAPLYCAAGVECVSAVRGPIVIVNHHLFSERELKSVLSYADGPVFIIGRRGCSLPEPDFLLEDGPSRDGLVMRVYGAACPDEKLLVGGGGEPEDEVPEDFEGIEEPEIYCRDMYMRRISQRFLSACAGMISALAGGARVVNGVPVQILQTECEGGLIMLFIGNDGYGYAESRIDIGVDIRRIDTVTKFPYKPVSFSGSEFTVKVPGRGVVVLEISTNSHG